MNSRMRNHFKIVMVTLFILSISILYGQENVPMKLMNAVLIIRPGIDDLGNTTVQEYFLNKVFKQVELLDGTIQYAKYGENVLEGNSFTLNINLFKNENNYATLGFMLYYQDQIAYLTTVKIIDNKDKKVLEYSESM